MSEYYKYRAKGSLSKAREILNNTKRKNQNRSDKGKRKLGKQLKTQAKQLGKRLNNSRL